MKWVSFLVLFCWKSVYKSPCVLLIFHLQTKYYMMAAIIIRQLGLRSSILIEARSALVTASAASSRLFSTSGPESRLLQSKTGSVFAPLNIPSFTQQVYLLFQFYISSTIMLKWTLEFLCIRELPLLDNYLITTLEIIKSSNVLMLINFVT